MKNYDSNRVMNGTYGEVWFDDEYLAEVEEAKAEVVAVAETELTT